MSLTMPSVKTGDGEGGPGGGAAPTSGPAHAADRSAPAHCCKRHAPAGLVAARARPLPRDTHLTHLPYSAGGGGGGDRSRRPGSAGAGHLTHAPAAATAAPLTTPRYSPYYP